MDFKNYLLNEMYRIAGGLGLENKIEVAEFRSFKMPDDKTTLLFVIRYITGNYVGDIKTQPIQVFCYSELNDMQTAYMLLDEFSKTHNNYQTEIDGNFIKMNFETPVSMRNFLQSETGYRASVYAFGNYIECEGVSDITSITYDSGKEVNFLSASLGYAAVLNTSKVSGDELNKSIKQEAGLTMTINLMHTNSDFCQDIDDIMYGDSDGNQSFDFVLTKTDGTTKAISMKLDSATFPISKTAAPTLTLIFRR